MKNTIHLGGICSKYIFMDSGHSRMPCASSGTGMLLTKPYLGPYWSKSIWSRPFSPCTNLSDVVYIIWTLKPVNNYRSANEIALLLLPASFVLGGLLVTTGSKTRNGTSGPRGTPGTSWISGISGISGTPGTSLRNYCFRSFLSFFYIPNSCFVRLSKKSILFTVLLLMLFAEVGKPVKYKRYLIFTAERRRFIFYKDTIYSMSGWRAFTFAWLEYVFPLSFLAFSSLWSVFNFFICISATKFSVGDPL